MSRILNNRCKRLGLVFVQISILIFCSSRMAWAGAEIVSDEDALRNLYVLSIGINNYQYQGPGTKKLLYSVNDANSIAAEFMKRGQHRFEKIETNVLPDSEATRANILAELDAISRKKGRRPRCICFCICRRRRQLW